LSDTNVVWKKITGVVYRLHMNKVGIRNPDIAIPEPFNFLTKNLPVIGPFSFRSKFQIREKRYEFLAAIFYWPFHFGPEMKWSIQDRCLKCNLQSTSKNQTPYVGDHSKTDPLGSFIHHPINRLIRYSDQWKSSSYPIVRNSATIWLPDLKSSTWMDGNIQFLVEFSNGIYIQWGSKFWTSPEFEWSILERTGHLITGTFKFRTICPVFKWLLA
jgi:hypothetical protein